MYRAVHFWEEEFSTLDFTDPVAVNAVKDTEKGDKIRSRGKPVHFSQQYQGTWSTLVSNCGFEPAEAKKIEARYQTLYKGSFDWLADQLREAANKGYGVGAFGLRVRCPVLKKSLYGTKVTTSHAAAESRTLGNALSGQSYCQLNGRASQEFMERVRTSKYKHGIHLCAHIHDCIYLYIEDDIDMLKWVNDNLIECMRWQELPELQHPLIKLSSNLDLAYPSWADTVELPNNISTDEIREVCLNEVRKRKNK